MDVEIVAVDAVLFVPGMQRNEKSPYALRPAIPISIVIILLAGVVYWFMWDDAPFLSDDSREYLSIAADISDGGLDNLYDRSFGYPLLLMLADSTTGPSRSLYFIQLSMHLVAVFLLLYLLIRLQVRGRLIPPFIVLSLLPPGMVITALVLTEGLSEFLIVVGTVLLLLSLERERVPARTLLLFVSGLAFGCAAVVRPAYQLLFVLLALTALLILRARREAVKRRIVLAVCMIAVPACVLGGAYAYSYQRVGFWGLDPSFGIHLSTKTARVVERLPDEYAEVREILVSNRDTILVEPFSRHTGANYIWRAVPELREATGLDKPELSKFLVRMNFLLIRKAPLHYLEDVLNAAVLYWFPSTTGLSNFDSRTVQLVWTIVHFVVVLSFFAVVFLLIVLVPLGRFLPREVGRKILSESGVWERFVPCLVIPFSIILYTMIVSTMFEAGHQRYRTTTDLLIFFFVVSGIHFLNEARSAVRNTHGAR